MSLETFNGKEDSKPLEEAKCSRMIFIVSVCLELALLLHVRLSQQDVRLEITFLSSLGQLNGIGTRQAFILSSITLRNGKLMTGIEAFL